MGAASVMTQAIYSAASASTGNIATTFRSRASAGRSTSFPILRRASPICRSVLIARELGSSAPGADANCVPWDVFATGQVTPQSTAYLSIPPSMRGSFREQVGNVNATVQLDRWGIGSPWSDEAPAINVGAEFRKDAVEFDPDEFSQTGDIAGFGEAGLSHSRFDQRERNFRRGPDSAGHRQAGAAAGFRGRISQILVRELAKANSRAMPTSWRSI